MEKYENLLNEMRNKFLNGETIVLDLVKYYSDIEFKNYAIRMGADALSTSLECRNGRRLNRNAKATITIVIAMIAMYEYCSGNLWGPIRNNFADIYDKYDNDFKVDKHIRLALREFKDIFNYTNERLLIAAPLIAAGVTHNRLYDFFDFSLAIYKENLLARRDISDAELEEEIYNVFNSISRTKTNNKDLEKDLEIYNVNHNKIYRLSAYTSFALLTGKNCEGIARMGAYCVRCIIKALNNETFNIEPFYDESFHQWLKDYNKKPDEKINFSDESKRWIVNLKYRDQAIYLYTKMQNVTEECDPNKVQLQILEDDRVVAVIPNEDLDFHKNIGGYRIDSCKIKLSCNILKNLKYRFVCEDKILFCSNSVLKEKDVAFFNENGILFKSGVDYDKGTIFVASQNKINDESRQMDGGYYFTELVLNKKREILVDGYKYFFKKKIDPNINGVIIDEAVISSSLYGKLGLYRKINNITFQTRTSQENLGIKIDGKIVETPDVRLIGSSGSLNTIAVMLPALSVGYHEVTIFNRKNVSNKKLVFKFVFDDKFKIDKDKDKDKVHITLASSFVNEKKTIKRGEPSVDFLARVDGMVGDVNLTIEPRITMFSPNLKDWFVDGEEFFFKDLINNRIYVLGSEGMEAQIVSYSYRGNDRDKYEISINKSSESPYYEVNTLAIRTNADGGNKLFKLTVNSWNRESSVTVNYYSDIDSDNCKMEYDPDSDMHNFLFNYKEATPLKCCIINRKTTEKIWEQYIKPGVEFHLDGALLKGFTEYTVELREKNISNSLFSGDVTLKHWFYHFYKESDILGQKFKIYKVELFLDDENKHICKDCINTTLTIERLANNEYDGKVRNEYEGRLRRPSRNYRNDNELAKLGSVFIDASEPEMNEKTGAIWLLIYDKDNDLLFYDENKRQIYDTTDINSKTKYMNGIYRYLVKICDS